MQDAKKGAPGRPAPVTPERTPGDLDPVAPNGGLSHLDEAGRARMVEVGGKQPTERQAIAEGWVRMAPNTLRLVVEGQAPKGDVFAAARIAGIQAAKRTPELIPLCHHVALTGCKIDFDADPDAGRVRIRAHVRAIDRTGVEMEALTAVSIAALTIYDMLKAVDRELSIESVVLAEKTGGRHGHYRRSGGTPDE